MKIPSFVIALVVTTALVTLGQEGTIEDVKHGAKKAGETVKNGLETAGEKSNNRQIRRLVRQAPTVTESSSPIRPAHLTT